MTGDGGRRTFRTRMGYLRADAMATANALLARLEPRLAPSIPARLPHPPIFIIGPPRSGSTVLFQLLATRYDLAYFANVHCTVRGAPFLAERRHRTAHRSPPSLTSDHGRTEGGYGPSECGEYWYRFFPRDRDHVTDIPEPQKRRLRLSLGALVVAADRPFLIKNLMCTARLDVLAPLFPEALFVVVRRDELDVGHSLLEARKRRLGDHAAWFSLRPPGYEAYLDAPPEVQVIEQVRASYALADAAREQHGPERFLDLSYEDLCTDTRGTLDGFVSWLAVHGAQVRAQGDVPAELPRRTKVRIDPSLYERMVTYAGTPPFPQGTASDH